MKKLKFFKNLPEKIEIFHKFPWKTQNFSKICLEKSKFFVKLPGKIEIYLTQILDPQISNQIDAADLSINLLYMVVHEKNYPKVGHFFKVHLIFLNAKY